MQHRVAATTSSEFRTPTRAENQKVFLAQDIYKHSVFKDLRTMNLIGPCDSSSVFDHSRPFAQLK
jgi:hypothetical protein